MSSGICEAVEETHSWSVSPDPDMKRRTIGRYITRANLGWERLYPCHRRGREKESGFSDHHT